MKKFLLIGLFAILSFGKIKAQEPILGEIRMFAGNLPDLYVKRNDRQRQWTRKENCNSR